MHRIHPMTPPCPLPTHCPAGASPRDGGSRAPKARARVAFDESMTSPSLPRAYPIVPVRGSGVAVEDADGNVFLDFASGIAVTSTGHAHPEVVEAIQHQAAELIHFSASDFYLPIYSDTVRRAGTHRADQRSQARLPGQQRRRGRRGVDQAGAPRHRPAVPGRVPGRLPRPHLRRRLADRFQVQVPRRLRSAASGRLPRAVSARWRTCAGSTRSSSTSSCPPNEVAAIDRGADPGRRRLHRAGRQASSRDCESSATGTGSS